MQSHRAFFFFKWGFQLRVLSLQIKHFSQLSHLSSILCDILKDNVPQNNFNLTEEFPEQQKELPYTPYFQLLAFIIFIPLPHPLFFFWIFWGQTADIRPHPHQLYTLLCAFPQTKPFSTEPHHPPKQISIHTSTTQRSDTVQLSQLRVFSLTELSSTTHMVWLALSHIRSFSPFCLSCQSSTVLTVWVSHSQAWPSTRVSPMFPFTQIQAVLPGRKDHGSCELLQALSQEARDGGRRCLEVLTLVMWCAGVCLASPP